MRQGFDNEKYIELQAGQIKKRIDQFGGKLFDDYHASRVLPGFEPSAKFRMLKSISQDVEVIIAINANDIEKNKARGDLGITYDEDVLRLADIFRSNGLPVAAVVLTQYAAQPAAVQNMIDHPVCHGLKGFLRVKVRLTHTQRDGVIHLIYDVEKFADSGRLYINNLL